MPPEHEHRDADADVLDVLAARWSPRAYDAQNAIDETKLATALEAARWSPSANNSQPWRFIVARRGTALHAQVVNALMGFNQTWAGNAAALQQRRVVADAQGAIRDNAAAARDAVSGVDLDTEAVDLIRFQQAYQASSRVIQVARETFQSILAID